MALYSNKQYGVSSDDLVSFTYSPQWWESFVEIWAAFAPPRNFELSPIVQLKSQDTHSAARAAATGPLQLAPARGSIQLDIENYIEDSNEFSIAFCSTVGHPVKLNRNINRILFK